MRGRSRAMIFSNRWEDRLENMLDLMNDIFFYILMVGSLLVAMHHVMFLNLAMPAGAFFWHGLLALPGVFILGVIILYGLSLCDVKWFFKFSWQSWLGVIVLSALMVGLSLHYPFFWGTLQAAITHECSNLPFSCMQWIEGVVVFPCLVFASSIGTKLWEGKLFDAYVAAALEGTWPWIRALKSHLECGGDSHYSSRSRDVFCQQDSLLVQDFLCVHDDTNILADMFISTKREALGYALQSNHSIALVNHLACQLSNYVHPDRQDDSAVTVKKAETLWYVDVELYHSRVYKDKLNNKMVLDINPEACLTRKGDELASFLCPLFLFDGQDLLNLAEGETALTEKLNGVDTASLQNRCHVALKVCAAHEAKVRDTQKAYDVPNAPQEFKSVLTGEILDLKERIDAMSERLSIDALNYQEEVESISKSMRSWGSSRDYAPFSASLRGGGGSSDYSYGSGRISYASGGGAAVDATHAPPPSPQT